MIHHHQFREMFRSLPQAQSEAAEATDQALSALRSGVSARRMAGAFDANTVRRARLAERMSASRVRVRASDSFISQLEDELLVALDTESAESTLAIAAESPVEQRASDSSSAPHILFGRRWAASLAVAATVLLALFVRVGPTSLGGIDSPATAIAATGTVTVGTPIASGTAVPVAALYRADS